MPLVALPRLNFFNLETGCLDQGTHMDMKILQQNGVHLYFVGQVGVLLNQETQLFSSVSI